MHDVWTRLRRAAHDERARVHPASVVIASAAFVVVTALLVAVGMGVGVSLVELVPTTAIEALVIAGLFVVAMLPVEEPPGRDYQSDPAPERPPQPSLGETLPWLLLLDRDPRDLPAEDAAAPPTESITPV